MTLRLTRAQVREIDRRAVADYGIPSIVLMENAARGAADVAMEMVARRAQKLIIVVCGGGNNGGDGLAIARHLHNRGMAVEIVPLWNSLHGDAEINRAIVEKMNLKMLSESDAAWRLEKKAGVIVDAIFGTGLSRSIEGETANLISHFINGSRAETLAIDLPSGLDCDTGLPLGPCVRAARTVTFVAEKAGFANPGSREFTGEITVADIGVPPELIAAVAAS